MPLTRVFLGLGSNIEREAHLVAGLDALAALLSDMRCSPVFESHAVGIKSGNFFNLVVVGETELPLLELDRRLKFIEADNGRYAPDRDIEADPAYALWPNPKSGKRVPDGASLQGAHRITGPGIPESLAFELKQVADFMPKIDLQSTGSLADGQTWRWTPVDRAQAYFLHAVGTQGKDVVLWSSADVPDAGQGIFDYLTGSLIERWTKEKVLLPRTATQCAIPKGIFAGPGEAGREGGGGLLSIIAYGPESHIAWPPRPSDPKQPWNPEWNVRVRTKSTGSAMLGMDLSRMQEMEDDSEAQPQEQKKPLRSLLKGLIGG